MLIQINRQLQGYLGQKQTCNTRSMRNKISVWLKMTMLKWHNGPHATFHLSSGQGLV